MDAKVFQVCRASWTRQESWVSACQEFLVHFQLKLVSTLADKSKVKFLLEDLRAVAMSTSPSGHSVSTLVLSTGPTKKVNPDLQEN